MLSKIKNIKKEIRTYDIERGEIEFLAALVDAECFRGREKYFLFRYLIEGPHKLVPEHYDHLRDRDAPLPERLQKFYDERPGLEEKVRAASRSRMMAVRELVREIKSKGEKVLIGCEFQNAVTDELERILGDDNLPGGNLGVVRVDRTVSPDIREIRITDDEKQALEILKTRKKVVYNRDEKYLSELSPSAKNVLNIDSHDVYLMSIREQVVHTFATNPDICALVASRRSLREGIELKEATHIIDFEGTTVPFYKEQFDSRTWRSGQHKQIINWRILSPLLSYLENFIEETRIDKQDFIDAAIYENGRPIDPRQIDDWNNVKNSEAKVIRGFNEFTIREMIGQHFNNFEGKGSTAYSRELLLTNNALFIATIFNQDWASTPAGNVARCLADIINAIQTRRGIVLEDILSAGAGPLDVSQTLRIPITAVDMNGYQLEQGISACEDERIPASDCFLGDVTNMKKVLSLEDKVKVFEPGRDYEDALSVEDASHDLVVSSFVFDLLDLEGRKKFLGEAHRILDVGQKGDKGYLVLSVPIGKVDISCRDKLLEDIERSGFFVDRDFTGTYVGRKGDADEKGAEAFVIVGKKIPGEFHGNGSVELRLRPEYRVVESSGGKKGKKKKKKKYRKLDSEYFVRSEDGMDLRNVGPETDDERKEREKSFRETAENYITIVENPPSMSEDEEREFIENVSDLLDSINGDENDKPRSVR